MNRSVGRLRSPIARLALALAPLISGCSFGPLVLEKSHGRFQESVKQVQDEEFLRNIVKLRYTEGYNNLDVASITAQFELGGFLQAQPFFTAQSSSGLFKSFNQVLPQANVNGANRPTISLVPDDESDTIRRLLTPVTSETILFFVDSGWPIGTIYRLWLDSANSVPNAEGTRGAGPTRACVPDYARFRRIADLLQQMVLRGEATFAIDVRKAPQGIPVPAEKLAPETQIEAIKNGMEYVAGPVQNTYVLARVERKKVLRLHPMALGSPEYLELCDLLWLQPGLTQYDVTTGSLPPYPETFPPPRLTTIDLRPRSTVQALFYLSHGVTVPPEHLAEGVAASTIGPNGRPFDWRQVASGLFTVCAVKQHHRPEGAYVAVAYRGYWFYIDDRDHTSKSTFNLMLQLTRLDLGGAPTQARQGSPILTLPVGR
jgi:hypothetical protein